MVLLAPGAVNKTHQFSLVRLAISPQEACRHCPELAGAVASEHIETLHACADYAFFWCSYFLPTLERRRDIVSQSWILPTVVIYNCFEIKVEK